MNITVTKNDAWESSYDLYGKAEGYPLEDGDGVFIGNYTIEPWESSITVSWTPPDSRTWYIRSIPIFRRSPGPGGNL